MTSRLSSTMDALLQCSLVISSAFLISSAAVKAADFKFDFAPNKPQPGYTQISPETTYDAKRGFGYLGSATSTTTTPAQVSVFAVDVEEGNYDVTIRFGDPSSATSTTVKAESRRLMIEKVETARGKYETRTFTVNVRRPPISTGGTTSLNAREKGPPPVPDWDDHLTFEFNGKHPGVTSMEIKPAKDAITLFIAGDSTVTDQAHEPYCGWGQMLPRFFQQGVAVSNQAESGLALFSFEHQKRLEKVLSMMKKGDYFFIQFGHNDQKDKRPDAGPFTTYAANLKAFVEAARSKGGIPVLVTPMERRRFEKDGTETPTLADYAEAVRQVGVEEKVPVIDLNAMSLKFYGALGPEKSTKAFVFYPANTFPGQDKPLADNTHHNAYGAYELARCVVEGIKTNLPELAKHLVKDAGTFDPAKPDAADKIEIPPSPVTSATEKPAGS
jgi:lysophospholipase L1-like esterase